MANEKNESDPPPQPPASTSPTTYTIHEASVSHGGDVLKGPPITLAQAVHRRQNGLDVVVCGPIHRDNSDAPRDIEHTALTGLDPTARYKREFPHKRGTGPNALPHYQPDPRPPHGHTFYETHNLRARV